ncbi:MAG TPA: 8-oxo-dGTP diphosphatase [Candidatus Andersenbacteria bacterium]|nr:8-oxo-dGTP diphosphatase [Candidatus Andersenbacteria bacterium]
MNKKLLTLCLIQQDDKILLGMAKRGKGQGKWNGFGGKVEEGETIEDATRREVLEESGVTVFNIKKVGILDFTLPGEEKIWQVHIFKALDYSGEIIETDEMKPQWFQISKIPFDGMWPDDIFWMPLFLEGKKFEGTFVFNDQHIITEHELREVATLHNPRYK